jgi:hypothetical protein
MLLGWSLHLLLRLTKIMGASFYRQYIFSDPGVDQYRSYVHIDVLELLVPNAKHFGHLVWFCEFMASLEGTDCGFGST